MTEALKRVFSMRAAYLGDPAFVNVPVESLLDSTSGRTGRFAIDAAETVPSDSLGGYPAVGREGVETTHYSVIDRDGMAVAVTYTLNDLFGCKVIVEGAGFFLNDEMDDFVTVPGGANLYGLVGGAENTVQPGKRPLSSMTPTMLIKDGKPVLILGARGGSKIISAVLQVIVNIVDFGMPPGMAVSEPRIHHQWKPDSLQFEHGAINPEVAAGLAWRGHHLSELLSTIGKVEAIFIDPVTGLYVGAPDPRENGVAAGY
jgi:gamma-glutamyltranspeptidase/glutathione hydrolase